MMYDVWSDEVSAQEKMNGSVVGLGDEESILGFPNVHG